MRVTSVEIHPAGSSDICVLSFRDPSGSNPYNVKSIVGLDADEIVRRYYGGPGFYNLTLEKRDIIARIQLNPRFNLDETYSSLRDAIYRAIASSRTGLVEVQFKDGNTVVASISGSVTRLEAPHFNKTPEVQISIECLDPMLRAPDPVLVNVTGLLPANTVVQDDLSTAPHGVTFEIEFLAQRSTFAIRDHWQTPTWTFDIDPSFNFLVGDVLHLSSEHNNKYVYIDRGGVITHLGDAILPGSLWPVVFPGSNAFVIMNGSTDYAWNAISYYPTYWGV